MPELPEVEIVARRLGAALSGAVVEKALVRGVGTLKSFEPPIAALDGRSITEVRRRGKIVLLDFIDDITLLVHMMSAGRLQIFDKEGSLRDKTLRLVIRLTGGRELRLREFGTRQSTWARLIPSDDVDSDKTFATMGPEAWPDPPPFGEMLSEPRPLHTMMRDQKVIAGIGRSWVDEILHQARLSPFKRGDDLSDGESELLRTSTIEVLGAAVEHYEAEVGSVLPDKFPMPLRVHGRQKEPCPRCQTTLEAVYYEDHVTTYCPACQTGGKVLKDRRLSRLLK